MHLPDDIQMRITPEPMSGCWLWTGSINSDGYGNYKRGEKAHRTVYILAKGEIPQGLELDHLCRVRCCVNPDHLEPVTKRINVLRSMSPVAIHARKTHCIRGHELNEANVSILKGSRQCNVCRRQRHYAKHPTAVPRNYWTDEQVNMLKSYWNEGLTTQQIADRMNRSFQAVSTKAAGLGCPRRVARNNHLIRTAIEKINAIEAKGKTTTTGDQP